VSRQCVSDGTTADDTARFLVEEFDHTRPRHGGYVEYAAPIFGMTPGALDKALHRARKRGFVTHYEMRPKWLREERSA
jgi:hypothetical protein